jgi:hypothetical protein
VTGPAPDDNFPPEYDPAVDFDDHPTESGDSLGARVAQQQHTAALAARYAFLSALSAGVKTNQDLVGKELQEAYRTAGLNRGSEQTPFGPVAMSASGGREEIEITDEAEYLTWSKEDDPASIEERVRPDFRKATLEHRFAIRDGQVVDTETGKVVPFARVKTVPAGAPTPTHSASATQRAAKMAAASFIARQLDEAGMPALEQLILSPVQGRPQLAASPE